MLNYIMYYIYMYVCICIIIHYVILDLIVLYYIGTTHHLNFVYNKAPQLISMCMKTCICAYIYIYIYIRTQKGTHAHTQTCVCVYIYIHVYTRTCIRMGMTYIHIAEYAIMLPRGKHQRRAGSRF